LSPPGSRMKEVAAPDARRNGVSLQLWRPPRSRDIMEDPYVLERNNERFSVDISRANPRRALGGNSNWRGRVHACELLIIESLQKFHHTKVTISRSSVPRSGRYHTFDERWRRTWRRDLTGCFLRRYGGGPVFATIDVCRTTRTSRPCVVSRVLSRAIAGEGVGRPQPRRAGRPGREAASADESGI